MTKEGIARALTALLIAALLGFFAYRKHATLPAEAESDAPDSAIWQMVEASRDGDSKRYLNCYTGEMERLLRQNLAEMGAEKFRDYLSSTYRQVKGIAVSAPQMTSPTEARVAVEYVYQDHNEVQQVYLVRADRRWKIFRVDGGERVKTLVPYGTPVRE